MRSEVIALLGLALATTVSSSAASPIDLVVDEFDDPVMIEFPIIGPTGPSEYVDSVGVGTLDADRRLDVVDIGVNAVGTYGVTDSAIKIDIAGAAPLYESPNGISFGGSYGLSSPVNLPGAGYDAVAIDLRRTDSSLGFLPRVDVFLRTASSPGYTLVSSLRDKPLSDTPSTLLFPLESFGLRAGVGVDDLDDVIELQFRVYALFLNEVDANFAFSAQIDRVRFTTLAPEPSGCVLAALLAATAISYSFSRSHRNEASKSGDWLAGSRGYSGRYGRCGSRIGY